MLNISNYTKRRIPRKLLEDFAKITLKRCQKENAVIDLTFLTNRGIKKLNKQYRDVDEPTDVLSFGYSDKDNKKFIISSPAVAKDTVGRRYIDLGEVFIAPEFVKKNAEKYGVDFRYELIRVWIHGILHLLGYEHSGGESKREKMARVEGKILSSF